MAPDFRITVLIYIFVLEAVFILCNKGIYIFIEESELFSFYEMAVGIDIVGVEVDFLRKWVLFEGKAILEAYYGELG